MKSRVGFLFFVFVFMWSLQGMATAAPQLVDPGPFNNPIETHVLGETNVYVEPNSEAAIVGKLSDGSDVKLVQARILWDSDAYDAGTELPDSIHHIWWRISSPIEGWVYENWQNWKDGLILGVNSSDMWLIMALLDFDEW